MNIKANPPRRIALIWSGIAILGIIIFFIPGIIGMDGFNGGYALSFLGGFVVLVGLIAVIIYARLASILDRITRKENLLARWTYTPEEWKAYTEKEHIEDKATKKGTFILIAAVSVIVGIVVWVIQRNHPLIILFIVIGIIAIMGLTAYLSAFSNYRQNKKYLGEAYIALDGIYLNRQLHIWKGIGNRLESAVYEDKHPGQPSLKFEYSSPSREERYYYTARIPVPPGQEETAKRIVAEIAAAHLGQKSSR
jgi:MFS family permease